MRFIALSVATPAAPAWMLAELERFSDRRWGLPPTPAAEARYLLDVAGMQGVLGPPPLIARAMVAHFKRMGMDVRTGVGATRAAALLMSHQGGGGRQRPAWGPGWGSGGLQPGRASSGSRGKAARGPAPIHALPVEALAAMSGCGDHEGPVDVAAGIVIFRRWGLRRLGEITALPADAVTERLGRDGTLLYRWAHGSDAGLRLPGLDSVLAPVPEITRAQAFEPALESTAALLAWLKRECTAAALELDRSDGAVEAIALEVEFEDGAGPGRLWRWEQRLITPHRDPRQLLRQMENALAACADDDGCEPSSGIAAARWHLELGRPRRLQAGLFGDAEAERERDERLVMRLRAILGDVEGRRVGSAELLDLHRSDSFHMVPFGEKQTVRRERQSKADSEPWAVSREAQTSPEGVLCLRATRPPIQLPAAGCRLPVAQKSEAPWSSPFAVRVRGRRVTRAAGPWRSSGLWWSGRAWSRDEWDVETEDGGLYRLAHDRRAREWLLLGIYD